MKLLFVIIFAISSMAATGQTNKVAGGIIQTNSAQIQTNQLKPDILARRAEFIKQNRPLRVFDGKLYDFTEFFFERNSAGNDWAETCFSKWIVSGKVIQVVNDGVLVDLKDSDLTIMLKNDPNQDSKIDGSAVKKLAFVSGRYQYTNTQGAKKTIIEYDCGRYFNATNDSFQTKVVIRANGKEQEVPVTEWDRQ